MWAVLSVVIALGVVVAVTVVGSGGPGCAGAVGFNWPNAGRVYLGGLTQKSTTAARPDRPFVLAHAHGLGQVRVFVGVDAAITTWLHDPAAATAGWQRLLSDAASQHVQIIVSNYPDLPMISALAGHDYPTWAAAQLDLTTPDSVPYRRFQQWLETIVPRFATNPTIASWEVINEPGYMLGIDNGTIGDASGLSFVEHFSDVLHQLGARTVNGGGRPVFDPMSLTDAQLSDYTRHIDILDDHLYPTRQDGTPPPTPAPLTMPAAGPEQDAHAAVADTARWFGRARTVSDRSQLPGMLGEVGSQPGPWFAAAQSDASARGWPTFAWAFDAYDDNDFTDTTQPAILAALTDAAHNANRIDGSFPVQVGTPQCAPPP